MQLFITSFCMQSQSKHLYIPRPKAAISGFYIPPIIDSENLKHPKSTTQVHVTQALHNLLLLIKVRESHHDWHAGRLLVLFIIVFFCCCVMFSVVVGHIHVGRHLVQAFPLCAN